MALNVDLDMRVDPESEVSMSVEDGDEVSFGVAEAIVVKDHATLENRDLPNQHPISAITGLAEALAESGKIDTVKVNGTALPVVNKAVDVPVPTTTSQLTNNSGFITADDVPNELFIVVFFVTSLDPLTVTTETTAYEVAEAVMDGKALYAVLFAGASLANLTPTTLVQDNGDVLVKFVFNEQGNTALGIKYFEISMLNDNAPSVLNIKIDPFLTGITSSDVTTALGYTPYSDTNPSGYITSSDIPVTSVNGMTGDVTGLAEASSLATVATTGDYDDLTDKPDLSIYMQKGVDYVTAGKKSGTTVGYKATAEGNNTTASGNYAHAEGDSTIASGWCPHAEGRGTTASGSYSHAEGNNTTASGGFSHAEGDSTTARGDYSHAEGASTQAIGSHSHAEGYRTNTSGDYSHAEGYRTTANRRSQHTFGEYNIIETGAGATKGTYVEIVGNGADDSNRSNARTLDWNGNEVLAGTLTVGANPTNNMEVATKQYVDGAIPTVPTNVSSFTNDAGYLVANDLTEATDADVIAIVV